MAWKTEDGKLRGKGIACFIKLTGTPSTTSSMVRLNGDGTVTILAGAREMGQGVRTVLPQMAASVLGIDVGKIKVSQVDTDFTPYDKTTTSSRSTFHSGLTVMEASRKVADQLCVLVARHWGVPSGDVRLEDGVFRCASDETKSLNINDIGKSGYLYEEPPILAVGSFGSKSVFDPPDKATHASKRPTIMWMMGAQAAEVEVDPGTGSVKIIQVGAAHDVGRAINPLGCYQQIEGGINMGIGHAILEEMIYDEKCVLKNGNMVDYKVPTSMDADYETHIVLVEHPHPEGPYGVKGLGEPGTAPTAPAVANAISAACGRRFHSIPIKPEHILFTKEDCPCFPNSIF
jgi:carbon-monoxide dehydrogenase large subunit